MRAHAEDDDIDENGLLRDGGRLRVPATFMDTAFIDELKRRYPPRYGHPAVCGVTDALGHGGLALNRPGYRFATVDGDAVSARDRAWEERGPPTRSLEDASSGSTRRGIAAGVFGCREARRLRPVQSPSSAASSVPTGLPEPFYQGVRADADRAWKERGQRMREAWKTP
jgi:hypothetical protein